MIKIGKFVIATNREMIDATTEYVEYHGCYFDGPVTVIGDHVSLIHCDIRVKDGETGVTVKETDAGAQP